MREVLFRGKDIAGNWHYGDLINLTEELKQICNHNQLEHAHRMFLRSDTMIDGKNTKLYDGYVRIYYDCFKQEPRAKTIVLVAEGTEDDKCISLDDCLELIGYEKKDKNAGVVYVTFDKALDGVIYQYGSYNDGQWHKYGTTRGYA